MARPRLQSVKVLRNAGARVVYATPAQKTVRWVSPDGAISVPEAALLLGMARSQVDRLIRRGRIPLELDVFAGTRRVPLVACRLLLAMAKTKRRTVKGGSIMATYNPERRHRLKRPASPAARS